MKLCVCVRAYVLLSLSLSLSLSPPTHTQALRASSPLPLRDRLPLLSFVRPLHICQGLAQRCYRDRACPSCGCQVGLYVDAASACLIHGIPSGSRAQQSGIGAVLFGWLNG